MSWKLFCKMHSPFSHAEKRKWIGWKNRKGREAVFSPPSWIPSFPPSRQKNIGLICPPNKLEPPKKSFVLSCGFFLSVSVQFVDYIFWRSGSVKGYDDTNSKITSEVWFVLVSLWMDRPCILVCERRGRKICFIYLTFYFPCSKYRANERLL